MSPSMPVEWLDVVLRLGAATLVGGLLGLNRDLHDKPAGLRTHSLVSLGAALVLVTSHHLAGGGSATDVVASSSRTLQGILTGVGFLGAGVILHDRLGRRVHGLTTAATLWISAVLGIACGAGAWWAALVSTVLIFAVLTWGGSLENSCHRLFRRSPEAPPPSCDPPSPPQHP